MQAIERDIFHRLLTHFHPEDYSEYWSHLEEPERLALEKMKIDSLPLDLKIDDPMSLFHKIHYSWFMETLKQLPTPLLYQGLSLLSKEQRVKISKFPGFKKAYKPASKAVANYLIFFFLDQLGVNELAPLCFLPSSPYNFLIDLSKEKLVHLIERLGLIEVAQVSKKIVDQKILQKLSKFLSRSQKRRYEEAQKQNEPKAPSGENFSKSMQDKKTFFIFLEKRGIERLARALVCEHPCLLWHIAHRLDIGRGQELLLKARRFMPSPITPFYQKQLTQLIDELKENEPS